MTNALNERLREAQAQCLDGSTSLVEAVREMNSIIPGGLAQVHYQTGLRFKVGNDGTAIREDLQYTGLNKRQKKLNEGLAVFAYFQAMQNGSRIPGEVHIDKGVSTKHYKGGIEGLVRKYVA